MTHTMRRSAATLALTLLMGTAAIAQDYDLVISNGRVMDPETLYDEIANVGITDGRIVEDQRRSALKRRRDEMDVTTGHVVAPGFIDTHFHWQAPLGYRFGLRDGLTSSMDLEVGVRRHGHRGAVRRARGCLAGQLRLCGQPRDRTGHRHRRGQR